MQVYIAMPEAQAFKVDKAKKVVHASLGLPQNIRYISIKDTMERAIEASVTGNAMKLPVATEVTVWNILQVCMPEQAAFKMVQDGLLIRDLNRGGWRLFDDLDFGTLEHQWIGVSLPPMGIEAWAEKTLMPCFQVKINSVCLNCKQSGAGWLRGKAFQSEEYYCARCWNSFYMSLQAKANEEVAMEEAGEVVEDKT
jgi:hypothetical protein